jgi:hypothetical protein
MAQRGLLQQSQRRAPHRQPQMVGKICVTCYIEYVRLLLHRQCQQWGTMTLRRCPSQMMMTQLLKRMSEFRAVALAWAHNHHNSKRTRFCRGLVARKCKPDGAASLWLGNFACVSLHTCCAVRT